MWKYCIETDYWRMRDLRYPVWEHKYYKYREQKYFKRKAEARKAFAKEIRNVKSFLTERRQQVGNCHEGLVTKRNSKDLVHVRIYNRFNKNYSDRVVITMKQVNEK